jgi:hypothetical protein
MKIDNSNWQIRLMHAQRKDITHTPEQIEKGLTDEDLDVRIMWIKRVDFTPMQAQVERGLKDEIEVVQLAWKTRLRSDMETVLVDDNYTMSSI